MNLYRQGGKRLFDLALVLLTAPIWAPLLVLVALLVRLKLGAPVLFRQRRPGKGGETFEIIKFRTMTDARDTQGALLPDVQRLTAFGRWLREVSLDELPELLNVLRGDMSLVGPRPLLIKYLPFYSREQARRHDVLPGITGWAQVKGRNAISWEDKFAFDVWYVEQVSWGLDIKIILMTLWKVLARKDIIDPGTGIHQEFTGSPPEHPPRPTADRKSAR